MPVPDLFPGVDAAAQGFIRRYCEWHIAPSVTESVTVDGHGGSVLVLPTLRLTAVDTVQNDGVTVAGVTWSEAGMLRIRGCWTREFRGVVAAITHGYDECPAELEQVAQRLAQAAALPVGAVAQSAGPFSVKYGAMLEGLDDYSRAILDRYRILTAP